MATLDTQGMTFARWNASASPPAYVVIGQIVNMRGLGKSRALIDTTNLASTAREFKKAIVEGKEFTIEVQYDPADAMVAAIIGASGDLESAPAVNHQVTFTDSPAETWTGALLAIDVNIDIDIDNVAMASMAFKPTGTSWTIA